MRDDNECDNEWNTNRVTVKTDKQPEQIRQRKGAPWCTYITGLQCWIYALFRPDFLCFAWRGSGFSDFFRPFFLLFSFSGLFRQIITLRQYHSTKLISLMKISNCRASVYPNLAWIYQCSLAMRYPCFPTIRIIHASHSTPYITSIQTYKCAQCGQLNATKKLLCWCSFSTVTGTLEFFFLALLLPSHYHFFSLSALAICSGKANKNIGRKEQHSLRVGTWNTDFVWCVFFPLCCSCVTESTTKSKKKEKKVIENDCGARIKLFC